MIQDYTLDNLITKRLVEESEVKKANHTPSGKLSASILAWPVQWQVLKTIGIVGKDIEPYVLRKFLRGNQIEEWLLTQMEDVVDKQKAVEYRGCVGYVDALVNHIGNPHLKGHVPHEIKSVANSKYRYITKDNEADEPHKLQGALYALALNSPHYVIDYIASDDYRISSFIYEAEEMKEQLDTIIDDYQDALLSKTVPVFVPRYKWQESSDYNSYPEWQKLAPLEIEMKLKTEYPDEYKKFIEV